MPSTMIWVNLCSRSADRNNRISDRVLSLVKLILIELVPIKLPQIDLKIPTIVYYLRSMCCNNNFQIAKADYSIQIFHK